MLSAIMPTDGIASTSNFPCPYSCDSLPRYTEVSIARVASSPTSALLNELDSLMFDCHVDSWDGHGAEAVSVHAYLAAARFIASLPVGFPVPALSADPEGCVTFEWWKSARRVLLVSVHPNFRLDYAALLGTAKHYGSEPFFGQVLPEVIRTLAQRVCAT